mgnify:CR=1 FL=1
MKRLAMKPFVLLPLAISTVLLVLLLVGLTFLLYTEAGLKYLASSSSQYVPQLKLQNPSGSLLGETQFSLISWQQEGVSIEISQAKWNLSPLCLVSLNLCAQQISADTVTVNSHSENTNNEPVVLPEISLPFEIFVAKTRINTLQINHNNQPVFIADKLQLKRFLWAGSTLSFSAFKATLWEETINETLSAKGSIKLKDNYPIKLELDANLRAIPDLSAYIQTTPSQKPAGKKTNSQPQKPTDNLVHAIISGSLQQLHAEVTLQGQAAIKGTVDFQPLDSQLPFSAALNLQQALHIIVDKEQLLLNTTQLHVNGNSDSLSANATGQLALPFAIGTATTQLKISTDYSSLTLEHAELLSEYGSVNVSGQLYFDQRQQSELAISAKNIDPVFIDPFYQGSLNADANITITQLLSKPSINVMLTQLNGEIFDQQLTSSGSIALSPSQQLQFQQWVLTNNGNSVKINGHFPNDTVRWSARIDELKLYLPQASGKLTAKGSLYGSLAKPSLKATINAHDLAHSDFQAKTITSNININQLGWEPSSIKANVHSATLTGIEGNIEGKLIVKAQQQTDSRMMTKASLWQFSEHLTASIELALQQDDNWNSSLHCNATVNLSDTSTTSQCKKILAGINQKLLTDEPREPKESKKPKEQDNAATATENPAINWSEWRNDQPLNFTWQAAEKKLQLDRFCLTNQPASICLEQNFVWQAGQTSGAQLTGKQLPLAWAMAFTPSNYTLSGDWGFTATLSDKPEASSAEPNKNWQLKGTIRTNHADIVVNIKDASPLEVAIEKMAIDFSADQQGANSSFSLASDKFGNMRGKLNYLNKKIQGELVLHEVDLHPFQYLFPRLKLLAGKVSSDINFELINDSIALLGQLSLTEFATQSRGLPVDISNGNIELNFLQQQANLTGQINIGEGNADLTGTATWAASDWKAKLALHTSTIRIEPLPDSYLNVNSDLTLTASPGLLKINGEVLIPKARIEVKKLPENAVGVSDDTVIDGQTLSTNSLQVSTQIKTELGDDVKFRGFGLETNLTGGLIIKQRPGQILTGNGVVNLIDGRFRAYGQDLSIEEGRMVFSGPLTNPELLVTAIRTHTDGNVRVGVLTTGPAQNPVITLFSSPTMQEQKILYYLLTGKSPDSNGTIDQSQLAQQTAIALALAQSNDRASDIATNFGIEDFQMTTDMGKDSEEAQFSGYITPDIYLRYGVSLFDQMSSITARYKLTPDVYVEIYDSASSAIDIFWSIVKE